MCLDVTGTIFDIKRYAIHDGPGIRTTVFFKGCPLRCLWCHNPESLRSEPEPSLRSVRCKRCGQCLDVCREQAIEATEGGPKTSGQLCTACGTCLTTCPGRAREIVGYTMDVATLVAEVEKDRLFYDQSGGGVTFSGGEPLMQPEFLLACTRAMQTRSLHIAVDTTCHGEREFILELTETVDLFLCDIKHQDPSHHRELTGVNNELILANIQALSEREIPIIIRLPLIGGYNDDMNNIEDTADFVAGLGSVQQVDILPYNQGGLTKTERLASPFPLEPGHRVEGEPLDRIIKTFTDRGLTVHVEG